MQPRITIYHDPEGINKRELIFLKTGDNLAGFLMNLYPDGFVTPTAIFSREVSEETRIDLDDFEQVNIELKDHDHFIIVHRPQGVEVVVAIIVAVVAAIVLAPDVNPPPIPENPNFPKTSESPNNRLTGQTNVARPLSRIPDIYGRRRVYPDLGTRTVVEYIEHIKFVTEYLIIGRGEYDIASLKSTDTLIDDISSAEYSIYNSYELVPELLESFASNEVNGQEIKAPNDVANFDISTSGVTFNDGTSFRSDSSLFSRFSRLKEGEQFSITGTGSNDGTYTFVQYSPFTIPAEPPDFEGQTTYRIIVEEPTVSETVNTIVNFESVGDFGNVGTFKVSGDTNEIWVDIIAPRGLADRRSGSSVEISITLDVILDELDSNDNIVNTETYTYVISDNTLDQRFYTFKIIPANQGAIYQATIERQTNTINDASYYDVVKWARLVGVKRISNFDQGNVTSILLTTRATDQATQAQERKFNAIVTRKLKTYNTTTDLFEGSEVIIINANAVIATNTFTVDQTADPDFTDFNDLVAGDKFVIVGSDENDGTYTFASIADVSGDWVVTVDEDMQAQAAVDLEFRILPKLNPTTKMADALMNHLTDPLIGNKSVNDIDYVGLYTIQDALDSDATYGSVLGRFSYSFSSDKASVKDELITIANSCRCFVKKVGHRVEFGRDQENTIRTTVFNGRNKKPRSEKKTIKLQRPTDFDGVELQWVYEDTGEAFTIHLPDDESALNPKKIDAAGIMNFKQAWNRANIEFKKLKLHREFVEVVTTKESLHLQAGDRVANADGTDINVQAGEIKAYDETPAGTYLTYDPIDFNGQADGTVIFRSEDGLETSEHTVTPRGDGLNGFFTSDVIPFTIRARGDAGYQVGTLFLFKPNDSSVLKDYIVQRVTPKDDNYVSVKMTRYNSSVFEADTLTPPVHETTVLKITADVVPSNNDIPTDHTISLAAAAAETLSWNAAPTGTYDAIGDEIAAKSFSLRTDGTWTVAGTGTTQNDVDNGVFKPTATTDTTSYEYFMTQNAVAGVGQGVTVIGTLNAWTPLTSDLLVSISDMSAGSISSSMTVEVREILTPANTTGQASFGLTADGTVPE
jgi:hypothetical protein